MNNEFIYLESEDANFCRSIGLTEEDALAIYSGVRGYTTHRLNRKEARQGHTVPMLPQTAEEMQKFYLLKDTKLTPESMAKVIIKDQINKVNGIIDAKKELKKAEAESAHQKNLDDARLETEIEHWARKQPDFIQNAEVARSRARAEVLATRQR